MHAVVVLLYRISLCVGTAVLHGSNYRVSIQDVRRRAQAQPVPELESDLLIDFQNQFQDSEF